MDVSIEGRVALVTGGGRGIGRAISVALARAGAHVAVNYRRDADAAEATVAMIEGFGGRASAYRGSVASLEDDIAMVDAVARDLGPIGILVNNAGVASRGHTVADTDPAELERLMGTHLHGPFNLARLVIPEMRKLERGDIIMISSVVTTLLSANSGTYSITKSALEALAVTLAREEREHGIYTNIIAPTLTVTDMGARLVRAWHDADIADVGGQWPFRHVCTPEEIANVVHFLVSPANGYVNGQRIAVDGGG